MTLDSTQERQQAHALLDLLPAEKLSAVRSWLEAMVEPLSHSSASTPVEEGEVMREAAAKLRKGHFFANQSIAELADLQKVEPLRDVATLAGGISAEDDVDEFLKEIYDARK